MAKEELLEIKKEFEENVVDGIATVTLKDNDAFFTSTDIEKKVIENVFAHKANYLKTVVTIGAEKAKQMMEDNKDITKVNVNFGYGVGAKSNAVVSCDRQKEFLSPATGDKIKKSTVALAVTDTHAKVGKTYIRSLSAGLTESLIS